MTTYAELWAAEQERQALAPWKARVEAAGYRAITEPWSPAPPAPGVRRGPRGAS